MKSLPAKSLPAVPNLVHLKKQAKQLLRAVRAGDAAALRRLQEALPAARGTTPATLAILPLRLHDAQSALAREYGFVSWPDLKRYVEWKRGERAARLKDWMTWVIEGNARQRKLAIRLLHEEPALFADDPWLACAAGDEAQLRKALARVPDFPKAPGGPLAMLPLIAVTHSRLILEDGFEQELMGCARLLLESGADVNATWTDPNWPDWPLSVLYGAAGRTHHPGMTKLLLAAGAHPDDNESLYHSVESADASCTQLLLDAGARVSGTNTIGRALDYDRLDRLMLLLRHGGDAGERPWLHHAIERGRSLGHVRALLDAGADLNAKDREGVSVYRMAQMHGRTDIVSLLEERGISQVLSEEEAFVAVCTRGDLAAAQGIRQRAPDILARLTERQLQAMPQLAAVGNIKAVRTMLAIGWPREVKTAWQATALNLAMFQGDAAMLRLLLDEGADWRTTHGFGDNVIGTLSFASQAEDIGDPAPRDYIGCARSLIEHGIPIAAFEGYSFSPEVTEYLEARAPEADG